VNESPAEPSPPPQAGRPPPQGGPTAEQLVEELRKAKVSDLLVHTSSMLASLAFGKLAPDVRDLEQARLAIDALKALGPLLDEGPKRDVQQVVANLQLAYAEAVSPK
jgi:ABC-type Fe3+ transport system substrate-binding protein